MANKKMERNYSLTLTHRERQVIRKLLKAKIQKFRNDIAAIEKNPGKYLNAALEIADRKQWITAYNQLISKLDSADEIE